MSSIALTQAKLYRLQGSRQAYHYINREFTVFLQ